MLIAERYIKMCEIQNKIKTKQTKKRNPKHGQPHANKQKKCDRDLTPLKKKINKNFITHLNVKHKTKRQHRS